MTVRQRLDECERHGKSGGEPGPSVIFIRCRIVVKVNSIGSIAHRLRDLRAISNRAVSYRDYLLMNCLEIAARDRLAFLGPVGVRLHPSFCSGHFEARLGSDILEFLTGLGC